MGLLGPRIGFRGAGDTSMAQQQLVYAWLRDTDYGNAQSVDADICGLVMEGKNGKTEKLLQFVLQSGPAAGQFRQLSIYGDNWNKLVTHNSDDERWKGTRISIDRIENIDKDGKKTMRKVICIQ